MSILLHISYACEGSSSHKIRSTHFKKHIMTVIDYKAKLLKRYDNSWKLLYLLENTFDRKRTSANPSPNPNFL